MKKGIIICMGLLVLSLGAMAQTNNQKDSNIETISTMEKIEKGVKNGYLLIEKGVVKGYKAIESGVVEGFTKVNDSLTTKLFGKEGETIDETKARLIANKESFEKSQK